MPEPLYTFAIFDDLSTYRTYLDLINEELGITLQSRDGYTDGTSFILTIPRGTESLVPSRYERVPVERVQEGFVMI